MALTPACCAVYALIDPRTQEVRYVGKTTQEPARRLQLHLARARGGYRAHVCSWIKELLRLGMFPGLTVLETVQGDGSNEERAWITYGRKRGWRLTNHTDGGEGSAGLRASEETRAKMREAQQRILADPTESVRRSNRTRQTWEDEDVRQRRIAGLHRVIADGSFSESNRKAQCERWARPGEREKHSERMKEVAKSPEMRAQYSAAGKAVPIEARRRAMIERYESPAERARVGDKSRQMWQDPDYRAKQSASRKARWEDQEYRARMSEARKAGWEKRKAKEVLNGPNDC